MSTKSWGLALAAALGVAVSCTPGSASACGGFFCSQTQGVNQAAERIVFADNGNGTVTAVIEIQYQGPADKFSWLLPISSVPQGDEIAVGSSLSFQRLQQATNPQYFLTTRVEGNCDPQLGLGSGGAASGNFDDDAESSGGESASSGVTVEASGLVGSFEWKVISLDPQLAEPADAAVAWLGENGYDVPQGAPGLLGPYLDDGLYLLALKLQKGASAGSIRPIVLTYDATKPMIPIKLTAVAANDDMGVLTWVLADAQAVPKNYYALELNEARINWFNPNANYNDVVIAAANEAGGQGFVTEFAGPAQQLAGTTWFDFEEDDWQFFKQDAERELTSATVFDAMLQFSQWDGFWEVVRQHVTLPADVSIEEVQDCPYCYMADYEPSAAFLSALEADVIEPAQVLEKLLALHPTLTRLYSTLSAAEMTVDPLFTFNPSLAPVSNVHSAERVVECGPGYYVSSAPWRIELPQGGVVRGGPNELGTWPAVFEAQPANRRILRQGESGPGKVLEDNSEDIDGAISAYSAGVEKPRPHGSVPIPRERGSNDSPFPGQPEPGSGLTDSTVRGGGCGCRAAGSGGSGEWWAVALAASLLVARRRLRANAEGAG